MSERNSDLLAINEVDDIERVIPVLDRRLRFGLPWREYGDRTTVIVLELDSVLTGLVVDHVIDVLSMSPESSAPPPRWRGADEQGDTVIQELGKRDAAGSGDPGLSIVLDVPRLLSAQEILSSDKGEP